MAVMASKDTDQLIEDELQALHQSIEQLNSGNSAVNFQKDSMEKSGKRKRANQADVQTQTPKKSRKRKVQAPVECLSDPDNPIDEILEEIALRKNLTTNNVKHLLRNIIANESVQEMLKCSLDSSLKMNFEPKLTRSKTKKWLVTQNISWPPSAKKASETQILMEEDFPEDSSDDEYRPNEDDTDNHSDEGSFLSSHTSDIGSPVSSLAPPTPTSVSESDTFKRPFPIEQPHIQDDLIGSRTRSKLPLNDTPLEHLELAFIPPDISTDMYDSDCDNEEWRKFLKEFVCPPSHHSVENVDDEEADPEYNVLEEEEEVDDEELRADRTVQITKKEVSELLSELFEEEFSSSDEETNFASQTNIVRVQPSNDDILQTAMSDIIVQLEPNSPGANKATAKPTGVVQPLVPTFQLHHDMPLTISFPTLDYASIEVIPQTYSYTTPFIDSSMESPVVFSPEAKLLLGEQMRMHVQLLTQMHLITAQQSSLTSVTEECRNMLQDLVPLTQRIEIANLHEALDLVTHWEKDVTKLSPEEIDRFQRTVVTRGDYKKFIKRSNKHPDRCPFNPKMVELMAESRVFIYPELLPKLAIFEAEPGPCKSSLYEEQLIAMGVEQFTPYCTELLSGSKGSVENLVCSMISHYMLPHRTAKQVWFRIKRMNYPKSPPNAMKYYVTNKVAPPIHHHIRPFDRQFVSKLCDVTPSLLPDRWRELMLIEQGKRHRCMATPFALRPSVSQAYPPHYGIPGITPLSELNVPTSTPIIKKRKSRTNSKKKMSDIHMDDVQIRITSQADIQTVLTASINETIQPGNHSRAIETPTVSAKKKANSMTRNKKKRAPRQTKNNPVQQESQQDNHTFYDNVEQRLNSPKSTDRSVAETMVSEEVNPISEDQHITENPKEAEDESPNNNESSMNDGCAMTDNIVPVQIQFNQETANASKETNKEGISNEDPGISDSLVESDVSSIHLEVTESDLESEPQVPLDASSPHNDESRRSSSSNQGAKRYVLIQRPDLNKTHVMHVWGPKLNNQANIPIRMVADRETQSGTGGTNTPPHGNQKSSGSSAGTNNLYSSGESCAGAGAGSSGGDDGDRPPSSPIANQPSIDDNVVMEDDDDEEDSISLDLLTTIPLPTNSAPTKGRSPAHRQIRTQRNAKRILDSWMADDDPSQPRSDAYAQIYFMKVRNRLEQQNPTAFKDFVTTLGHFQSVSSSTLELYRKVESILGENHQDLMEEFVLFLSPEAAAQCGVQFQHFLYVRMREFFSKLKIHFKDSPSQLKRTLKTLQQVESSPSPNVHDIKNAILPLLKGNTHLTQVFLQLFPDDAPLPSDAGDFEDINMDKINSGDEFEYVHFREAATQSKESEVKTGKRAGSKGSAKNKSKGKSWKKSS